MLGLGWGWLGEAVSQPASNGSKQHPCRSPVLCQAHAQVEGTCHQEQDGSEAPHVQQGGHSSAPGTRLQRNLQAVSLKLLHCLLRYCFWFGLVLSSRSI